MLANYVILLLVIAILYTTVRLLRSISWSRSDGEVPLLVGVSAAVAAFAILSLAVRALGDTMPYVDLQTGIALVVLVLAGAPVVALYVQMIARAVIGNGVDLLYGFGKYGGALRPDYSAARSHVREHNVPGAVQKYREYFAHNPRDPEPLFLSAVLLEMNGQLTQARAALREIMASFREDTATWSEAAYRLANIECRLGENTLGARDLFNAIADRTPDSALGAAARERLRELRA